MKRKLLLGAVVIAAAGMMSSCAVGLQTGIYTNVTTPVAVTSNVAGSKVGTSSAMNILGIVAIGDAGIDEATKKGGIKNISHVDTQTTNVLMLFHKVTTVVYGE